MCVRVRARARARTCARLSPSSLRYYWDGGRDTGSGARPGKSRQGPGRTALGPRRGTWEAGYEGQRLVKTWGVWGTRKLGDWRPREDAPQARPSAVWLSTVRPRAGPGELWARGPEGPHCPRPQPGTSANARPCPSPLPHSRPSTCLPGSLRDEEIGEMGGWRVMMSKMEAKEEGGRRAEENTTPHAPAATTRPSPSPSHSPTSHHPRVLPPRSRPPSQPQARQPRDPWGRVSAPSQTPPHPGRQKVARRDKLPRPQSPGGRGEPLREGRLGLAPTGSLCPCPPQDVPS